MKLLERKEKPHQKPHQIIITLFFIGLIAYFVYHAISGDRGLIAFVNLTQQLEKAQGDLDNVRAERLDLEHRVNLMRSESLDLDLVDEQARKTLGYARPNEKVYYLNSDKKSTSGD